MSDQSKIHTLYVNNEPYLIGSLRPISMRTKDEVRPENFESFCIEDKLDELIRVAKTEVSDIETMRLMTTYPCEHELSVYSHIKEIAKETALTKAELLQSCMLHTKGITNPHLVSKLIETLFLV